MRKLDDDDDSVRQALEVERKPRYLCIFLFFIDTNDRLSTNDMFRVNLRLVKINDLVKEMIL